MSQFLSDPDWFRAIFTALGFFCAIVTFVLNRYYERRGNRRIAKKEAYDAFFFASESYNALLRTYAYKPETDMLQAFANYEACKSKIAMFGSSAVLSACGEYDKTMRAYYMASRKLTENEDYEREKGLKSARADCWITMQRARQAAIVVAMQEVNSHPDMDHIGGVQALYGTLGKDGRA